MAEKDFMKTCESQYNMTAVLQRSVKLFIKKCKIVYLYRVISTEI